MLLEELVEGQLFREIYKLWKLKIYYGIYYGIHYGIYYGIYYGILESLAMEHIEK